MLSIQMNARRSRVNKKTKFNLQSMEKLHHIFHEQRFPKNPNTDLAIA